MKTVKSAPVKTEAVKPKAPRKRTKKAAVQVVEVVPEQTHRVAAQVEVVAPTKVVDEVQPEMAEQPAAPVQEKETSKLPIWSYLKKPWVKYAAIGLAAIAIGTVIAIIHRNHEQKQKAETVRRKKELLDQVINVINAKISKQDTVILTDRQSAEVYRNDRVAFEHAMKDMRQIDLKENKNAHEKFDGVGSDDALRLLIDQLLTANE